MRHLHRKSRLLGATFPFGGSGSCRSKFAQAPGRGEPGRRPGRGAFGLEMWNEAADADSGRSRRTTRKQTSVDIAPMNQDTFDSRERFCCQFVVVARRIKENGFFPFGVLEEPLRRHTDRRQGEEDASRGAAAAGHGCCLAFWEMPAC